MQNDEIVMLDPDTTDLTPRTHGGLFEANADSILILAQKAEEYVQALNKIMDIALKITNEDDWVLIGGMGYLQETGASKVSRLFGVSTEFIGQPTIETDNKGYKTFTYRMRFILQNQFVECEGTRSMREDFFAKTKQGLKKPDEIDERDVKMAAYTNCLNNGLKRLIPNLRNVSIATLEKAGLDVKKIKGYTFKNGSQGGSSGEAGDSGLVCADCGEAVTQKVASYSQGKYGKILCYNCQKKQGGNTQE